jgi:hypothetical protein
MDKDVLGEFERFTLIYEEKSFGGIGNWCFLGVYSGSHVSTLRRGDNLCYFFVILGELKCQLGVRDSTVEWNGWT